MTNNKPKKETSDEGIAFKTFLAQSENVKEMRNLCEDVTKHADAQYMMHDFKIKGKTILPGQWLKQTISAMDGFIKVGDVAFKGGAESVSLGWTAVKWVLSAVKADADRCEQWARASEMISRILLTCRTIGKMYSNAQNTKPTELVQQLLKDIPRIYESILTYSWAARRQVEHSGIHRMASAINPFSSSAAASEAAFEIIKQYYDQIRQDGQTAFHEFANEALKSLDAGQQEVLNSIKEAWDTNQKQMQEFSNSFKDPLEEVKKFKPLTPYRTCQRIFKERQAKLSTKQRLTCKGSTTMLHAWSLQHIRQG